MTVNVNIPATGSIKIVSTLDSQDSTSNAFTVTVTCGTIKDPMPQVHSFNFDGSSASGEVNLLTAIEMDNLFITKPTGCLQYLSRLTTEFEILDTEGNTLTNGDLNSATGLKGINVAARVNVMDNLQADFDNIISPLPSAISKSFEFGIKATFTAGSLAFIPVTANVIFYTCPDRIINPLVKGVQEVLFNMTDPAPPGQDISIKIKKKLFEELDENCPL